MPPPQEEKKDAYIEEPQKISQSEAELEEVVSTIKEQIATIAKQIEDCKKQKKIVESAREKLTDYYANGGIAGVIAVIFRPDNDKRYERAKKGVNDCVSKYSSLVDKLVLLKDKLSKLMVVIKLITTWAKDINALTTSRVLKMVFPELKWPEKLMNKGFNVKVFNTICKIVGALGFAAACALFCCAMPGLAMLAVLVPLLLVLAGGLCKAEMDKKFYEDYEKESNETRKQLDDCIGKVDESLQNIDDYWSKVGQLLIDCKLLDAAKKVDQDEILSQITILSHQIAKHATMWKSFYRHVNEDGSNLDEEAKGCAEDVGKEDDADTIKMFKLYWYAHSNKYTIEDIKKQMYLTNQEYEQLLVILLLNQGVPPNEIEKRVQGVPKDVIQNAAVQLKIPKGG